MRRLSHQQLTDLWNFSIPTTLSVPSEIFTTLTNISLPHLSSYATSALAYAFLVSNKAYGCI